MSVPPNSKKEHIYQGLKISFKIAPSRNAYGSVEKSTKKKEGMNSKAQEDYPA